jgi:hypothetical protein
VKEVSPEWISVLRGIGGITDAVRESRAHSRAVATKRHP